MVRVRYAPSPTGSPHVGNIRTALFNYLLARRFGGQFIVRVEDTDRTREVPGAVAEILESLRWLGIEWDEGPEVGGPFEPYFQSERRDIYLDLAEQLLEKGAAYPCFCTPAELEEMRETQRINKLPTGYDRRCRHKSADEIATLKSQGKPFVIRLAMPLTGKTFFEDAVRGKVEYENALIDDQVLIKSDGWPTYHMANVVDDHLMGITHVIRGEEWISSTPKHIVLYEAFGWEKPVFAHAPVIKGPDGHKLSKRHGDTRCLDYRDKGFLGPAVANFIALIGWSPGHNREIMTLSEMSEAFSIEGIQPSPGVFDIEKLLWMNGCYIRTLSPDELYETVRAFQNSTQNEDYLNTPSSTILAHAFQTYSKEYVQSALILEQERVRTLADFAEASEFFFTEEITYDTEALAKWQGQDHIIPLFECLVRQLSETSTFLVEDAEKMVDQATQELGLLKRSEAIHPLRVALTGRSKGPGLFELMSVLGKETVKKRLQQAIPLFLDTTS